MKLWLLERTDNIGYDEYTAADEGHTVWEAQLTCDARCIAEETSEESGIVLEAFNAG